MAYIKYTFIIIYEHKENTYFIIYMCVCVYIYIILHVKSLQLCMTLETLWTIAHQVLSIRILQARILEWVAKLSFRGSSQPRD